MNCIICNYSPVDMDHIWTRKAFPEFIDCDWNKMPVCRKHHNLRHAQGVSFMAKTYPEYKAWLLKNNWYYDDIIMRWQRRKDVNGVA